PSSRWLTAPRDVNVRVKKRESGTVLARPPSKKGGKWGNECSKRWSQRLRAGRGVGPWGLPPVGAPAGIGPPDSNFGFGAWNRSPMYTLPKPVSVRAGVVVVVVPIVVVIDETCAKYTGTPPKMPKCLLKL